MNTKKKEVDELPWWLTEEKLTRKEAANMLGVHPKSLDRLWLDGRLDIEKYRIGRSIVFRRSDVIQAARQRIQQVK